MANLKNLKKRIRLVKNISKVTKAMQVSAALKMKKAQESAIASRLFSEKLSQIASLVATESVSNTNSQASIVLVLIAPDRGLCGALLSNLERGLHQWLDSLDNQKVQVICVNQKSALIARHLGLDIIGIFDLSVAKPDQDKIGAIIKMITTETNAGTTGFCYVGYAKFENLMVQHFAINQLLPFIPTTQVLTTDILIEPNKADVYATLVPRSIRLKLYQAILETSASEFSARAMAMKSASENASDIASFLTTRFNNSRQAAITAQIAEVIGAGLSNE
jgi:F-type H+-transporting ATPase subunit gamma